MRLLPILLIATGCSEYGLSDGNQSYPGLPNDTAQPDSGEDDDGGDDGGEEDSGEEEEDDPDDSGDTGESDTPTPSGKVLTILLTLSDDWMNQDVARSLLLNSVSWAAPADVPTPRVLVIRDDDHSDEDAEDSENIWRWLLDAGFYADFLDEPSEGIDASQLNSYHVAILSNPGHSPDDLATVQALYDFSCTGMGIIFQGDDMAHFDDQSAFSMESLTRLVYQDNGTEYHGYQVDNDEGDAYQVQLTSDLHAIVEGIAGEIFRYGNDIDTTEVASSDVAVLAQGTVEGTTLPLKPVIAAWSP